jgi:glucans biosynthesis protein
MQRDRDFDHYQDDGAFYDRRPSLWVEPRGRWGQGSVQLLEIPTVDETFDNIVAFWHPSRKPQAGEELLYSYRLHWGVQTPGSPEVAHVVATHTGVGGVIGKPRTYYSRRFVIDFAGGLLARMGPSARVEAVITASRGDVEIVSARPLAAVKGYRAMFDLKPTDTRTDPIDLRLFLRSRGRALTETWLYQWNPPAPEQRSF